jgi:hypothetical protein
MKQVQTESVNGIRTLKAQVVPAFPVAVVTSLFNSKLPQLALSTSLPGGFFERHGQSCTQSRQQLKNGCGFGFQDGFHDYLALGIDHRHVDRCLMNFEPIYFSLFTRVLLFLGGGVTIPTYSKRRALLLCDSVRYLVRYGRLLFDSCRSIRTCCLMLPSDPAAR